MSTKMGNFAVCICKGIPGSRRVVRLFVLLGLLGVGLTSAGAEGEWPREIETPEGLVVIYQPQLDRLDGNDLYARSAVSVTPVGKEEPIFGAVWMEARIETDTDARTVDLRELRVPRVRFPEATPEQEKELADLLVAEIPKWDFDLSLDRLLAMLEIAEKQDLASQGFKEQPPKIEFVDYPAVLVTFDGEPELRKMEDSDLQIVINTPFFIVGDPKEKAYYLYGGNKTWYRGEKPEGPWKITESVPGQIEAVAPADEEVSSEEAGETTAAPPAIITSTEPTELIVTDGPPEYIPISDGELLYLSNSESDVLKEVAGQRFFVLLSGRWFASPSLKGPWEYVASDELPESFARIPAESERGHLLTWVAGTEMAREAVLDAHIPQTAAIRRDATIEVTYDGKPKFEKIKDTSLEYAVNTQFEVIKAGAKYYCAYEAVWYVADDPNGPWRVADKIPEEILALPPDCPLYHCKYLYVYDSTPELVYVGYYPGYLYSYVYDGCLVYGTGWYYRPWRGRYWYYPRPRTWGLHVRWNPWRGWGFGFSYSTGRFTFGLGTRGPYRRGWWGPGGYRGYRRGHYRGWNRGYSSGRRDGYRAGKRDTARNIYQQGGNVKRVASGAPGGAKAAAASRKPSVSSSRTNNVYSDKAGDLHRRQEDGSWQTQKNGEWTKSDVKASAPEKSASSVTREKPSTSSSLPTTKPKSKPKSAATQPSRSSMASSSSLNLDYQARERGAERSSNYKSSSHSKPKSPSRPSGGGRSGGGRPGGGRPGGGGRR